MSIPVEYFGTERQRIPAVLVKIEKSSGFIKFNPGHVSVKVPLSDLQLAPSAYEKYNPDPFVHTRINDSTDTSDASFSCPHDLVEIWLNSEITARQKASADVVHQEDPRSADQSSSPCPWSGAWWPGRMLNVHGGFAHVEVAAPVSDTTALEDPSARSQAPNIVRLGSLTHPYRSTLVKISEVRLPWTGRPSAKNTSRPSENGSSSSGDTVPESVTLANPGVLHRHTVCIPAYLARLASSVDSHSALLKFCDAPCLIQCDPEPFLSSVLAKRLMEECESAAASGRQTPSQCADSETNAPSVVVSANLQSSASWPSAYSIMQSALLNPPNIAGTLSPAGVTDPTLLLEGLPDANGPLVFLHVWSGSTEAIRRAALLELAHVRILTFRYHLLRKLSKGESGDLDLADSMDTPTENGDAPAMYCKPISIPVHVNPNDDPGSAEKPGEMMIGYSAQFRVSPRLIGLAVGYRGSTIQEARSLPGVRTIEMLPDGIIYVEAETVEACQSVRNLLDYTEVEIPVSARLASRLIGYKGVNIQKLKESAGVRRAHLLDPLARKRFHQQAEHQSPLTDGDDSGSVTSKIEGADSVSSEVGDASAKAGETLPSPAFYILGTRPAVAKMRLLLEFQADNLNELDELEEARRNLSTQLVTSGQPGALKGPGPTGPVGNSIPRGGSTRGRGRRPPNRNGSNDVALPTNENVVHPGRNGRPPPPQHQRQQQDGRPVHPQDQQKSEAQSMTTHRSERVPDQLPKNEPKQDDKPRRGTDGRGRGRNRPRNPQPVTVN